MQTKLFSSQYFLKKATCFLFSALCALQVPLSAQDDVLDLSQMVVETTVEWESTPSPYLSSEPFTPLVHYNGASYFVWVDANYRPWLTKVVNGTPILSPLDANSDYKAQPDGHHRFSLGIDTDGYIHVVGDMHNYSQYTDRAINPYPARYQKQAILYWKSNKPEDISAFTFAGGLNSPTAIPGSAFTYGNFFTDNNGVLYFSALEEAVATGNFYAGKMGIGLAQYDTKTKTWTALGDVAPINLPERHNKLIFWEVGGIGGWFQGFWPFFGFDSSNRMHFAAAINTDVKLPGTNRLIYAASEDGGKTWKKANGMTIPGVPIRAADGQANIGDVVAASTTESFGDNVCVNADRNGTPGVYSAGNWYTWNGQFWATKWTKDNALNFPIVPRAERVYLDPNQDLIFFTSGICKILRANSFNSPSYGTDLAFDGYTGLDRYSLLRTGNVYGVGIKKATNTLSILKTTMRPAPLACGWKNKDIAALVPSYRSSAAFANNAFYLNNYGSGIGATSDNFQYTYKKLSGDGVIIARVNSTNESTDGFAKAGLMIRQDLSAGSVFTAVLLAPGTKNVGTSFSYRNKKGVYSTDVNTAGNVNSYWVKLTREGNMFKGFTSPDGLAWKKVGEIQINMPNTVYIGLAATNGANNYYMQKAIFDQVTAPWGDFVLTK
jgi:regulation of enolase protein 1 (concanavalin A-like superfamily)